MVWNSRVAYLEYLDLETPQPSKSVSIYDFTINCYMHAPKMRSPSNNKEQFFLVAYAWH